MELSNPYLPPPKVPISDFETEYVPPAGFVDYWDWSIIQDNKSGVRTGRLAPWLRDAARTHDPLEILGRAVIAKFYATNTGNPTAESQALADLAVTGRAAFSKISSNPIDDESLLQYIRLRLPGIPQQQLQDAVCTVLDRAYTVAWALRGSPSQRQALRPGLGWIALSSEDDSPHVPTNVPCSGDYMGELEIRDGTSLLTLRATLKLPTTPETDQLPDISKRQIPALTAFADALSDREAAGYDELFLFIHGLASRAEESEIFKQELISKGAALGRRYAVLSVDLPGMGYSSRIDLDSLISRRVGGGIHGFNLPDGVGSHFPLLGLYRDTLVQICNSTPGGIQYVMGGSLGGNMTLWLAAEPMFTQLAPSQSKPSSVVNFLAWSPASIWKSYERARDTPFEGNGTYMDIGKNGAKKRSYERMNEREASESRWRFFETQQRGEEFMGPHIVGAWWGYPPVKANLLLQSELYYEQYRRMFWAAGYEQVEFSHQERLAPSGGLPFKEWPFKTIRKPLLLAAGAKDDGSFGVMDIYNPTIEVTNASPDVPGLRLLMLDTRHSISDEQPVHLAEKIVGFLKTVGYTFGQTQDQIKRFQTFICSDNQLIVGIDVKVKKLPSLKHTDIIVELYDTNGHAPTGNALASATISAASVGTDWTIVNAPLHYLKIVKGREYAVVLSQRTPGAGLYEWAISLSANDPSTSFGKWNGSSWVNESSLGDGWLKLWTMPWYLVSPVDVVHASVRGNGFGNLTDEVKRYQTFKLPESATVIGVDLKLRKYNGSAQSNIRAELFSTSGNRPTGSPLASGSLPSLHIGSDWTIVHVPIKSPPLPAGTYAIVLTQSSLSEARYEWAVGETSSNAAFGKWNGSSWIDESGLGDGWARVWTIRPDENVDLSHTAANGYGFGNSTNEIRRYQTFSVPQNYRYVYQMMGVQLKVRKYNGSNQSDLVVQLFDTDGSKPIGFAKATAIVASSCIDTNWTVVTVPLHYYVVGKEYAIVLSQRYSKSARYEWAARQVSDSHHFGKWNGTSWIDESSAGDGWLKVSLVATDAPT